MDSSMKLWACIWFAVLTTLSRAATFYDVQTDTQQCLYERVTTTRTGNSVRTVTYYEYHAIGEKWTGGRCKECSCSVHDYQNVLTCYLPMEMDSQIAGEPMEYNVTSSYALTRCPYLFKPVVGSRDGIMAQMFVTYRVVKAVGLSCSTYLPAVVVPEGCDLIFKEDGCTFDMVMSSDHSQPCGEMISMVG